MSPSYKAAAPAAPFFTDPNDRAVIASQHWSEHCAPERRLMLAVLEEARKQLEQPARGAAAQKLRAELVCWFLAPPSPWLFSFVNICEMLGLDPQATRARILATEPAAITDKPLQSPRACLVLALLPSGPPGITAKEIAAKIETSGQIAHEVLCHLVRRGRARRLSPGHYAIADCT